MKCNLQIRSKTTNGQIINKIKWITAFSAQTKKPKGVTQVK